MNSLKMLFAIVSMILSSQSVMAAEEDCLPITTVLTCQADYQLESNYSPVMQPGPVASAGVENLEVEPFDPAVCVNSVVLFTYAGRFIATYYHRDNTFGAHIYSDGHTTILADYITVDPRQPMNMSMKSPFKGIVDTIHFTCALSN